MRTTQFPHKKQRLESDISKVNKYPVLPGVKPIIHQSELRTYKNLQGGTFAFAHLFLQISESHIPYEVFLG